MTLQTVPGIGETKARALLQRFHCVFQCFSLFCSVCQCI